jgi:Methylamine utilisation protein MauE
MPDPLLFLVESTLALTFTWAFLAKVVRRPVWMSSLEGYGFEGTSKTLVAFAVPVAELITAGLVLFGPIRVGLAVTLFLVSTFSLGILQARARGGEDKVPCGCFGKAEERDYRWLLVRNALLGALAGTALLAGAEDSVISLADTPSSTDVLPALFVAVGALLVGWLAWQIVHLSRKEHP